MVFSLCLTRSVSWNTNSLPLSISLLEAYVTHRKFLCLPSITLWLYFTLKFSDFCPQFQRTRVIEIVPRFIVVNELPQDLPPLLLAQHPQPGELEGGLKAPPSALVSSSGMETAPLLSPSMSPSAVVTPSSYNIRSGLSAPTVPLSMPPGAVGTLMAWRASKDAPTSLDVRLFDQADLPWYENFP